MTKIKDPKRVAAGKKSSGKGSSNERKLAKAFCAWWGHGQFVRTPKSGGWATKDARVGFKACGDIMTTAADFPFCVEAKKREKWWLGQLITNDACQVLSWWEQTLDQCPPNDTPILVMNRNRVDYMVVMAEDDLEDFGLAKESQLLHEVPYFIFTHPERYWRLYVFSLKDFFAINPTVFGRKCLAKMKAEQQHGKQTEATVAASLS